MKVGLQTNVFTGEMHTDQFPKMLQTIKETGYDGFEIGVQRVDLSDAAGFARMVQDAGLEVASIHTHLRLDDADWLVDPAGYLERSAEFAAAVGATYLPMSGRRMDKTDEQLDLMVDLLNRFGPIAQAAGLRFCYHHHDWEFADNGREIDFLMEKTDADTVKILSDIGWIIKAGRTISDVIDTYGDRIEYFHVKDTPADGWFTELGKGIVPIDEFVGKLDQVNPEWLMVERDEPLEQAAESARECRNYLKDNFGI